MNFSLNPKYFIDRSKDPSKVKSIILDIKELNNLYLDETYKENKVSYYYEDSKNNIISFNDDIAYYAASSIKILVCLYLYEEALKGKVDLKRKVLITKADLRPGSGVLNKQNKDTYYTIDELIRLSLVESDNTAYVYLANMVGKKTLKCYGLSLGATLTMQGKETDLFGLINIKDMLIYWKKIISFIKEDNKYSKELKSYLINPSFKIIDDDNLDNNLFIRKYGEYDIAYHEAGYVCSKNPYYLIILTQLDKKPNKKAFVNQTAKILNEINKKLDNL